MSELWLYLAVFGISLVPFLELWLGIPVGILAGLPWLPTAIVAFAGNALSLLVFILAGERLRAWWRRSDSAGVSTIPARAQRVFDRYGVPGMAFLGTFLVGSQASALAAMALGAPRRWVVFWMLASLIVYALLVAILMERGVDFFTRG